MPCRDPDTAAALREEIITLCGELHRREYQLLERIRRLDALERWDEAMPSCAHWLSWRCGFDMVTAREKVRVARALGELPAIRQAFRDGTLSYSKVRAVTRIATRQNERELLSTAASMTAAHLDRLVRAERQAEHLAEAGAAFAAYRRRGFNCHTVEDGSLVFEGRLPAEQGALLLLALDRAMEWLFREERDSLDSVASEATGDTAASGQENAQPLPQRRADALAALGERFLASPPEAQAGLHTADRFQLTIHAPAEALTEYGPIDREDPPQAEHGPVLAGETVRRIGCDTAVVRILEDAAGEPLDVGRKTRVIPPAIRRALQRRDGGCRFPGCTHTRFVDGHHIRHWADGGETKLSNLVTLCRQHHRLLHEGGYYVVKDGESFIFCRGDGLLINPVNEALRESVARAEARCRGARPPPRRSAGRVALQPS